MQIYVHIFMYIGCIWLFRDSRKWKLLCMVLKRRVYSSGNNKDALHRREGLIVIPKGPCRYMGYTWALK